MDFIARAGGALQKSNRIAGFLLILLIVEGFMMMNVMSENDRLGRELASYSRNQKVYVVPGSTAGIYSPRQIDVLLHSFADHVTQSLLTFTYASLEGQYLEVRKFFDDDLLVGADAKYTEKIQVAKQDERSSLFIPQRNSMRISAVKDPRNPDRTLKGVRHIELIGLEQFSLGGKIVESAHKKVIMEVEETNISATNPFGFRLRAYHDEELSLEEQSKMGLKN